MVDVITAIEIDRPVTDVAGYAGDPSNAPEWYENIRRVEWETAPPLAVGSRLRFEAAFLGRTLHYTYEIRELVANERLVMSTAEGPFPMETSYRWEPVGAGRTRVTLRNRGEPAGFARALAPLTAPAMRRANIKDLRRLKAVLEGRAG